ncbi:MAG TPA: hypothetical protein VGN54_10130 [Mycobacteriales bacterium]|jgi:N-dimethylarginine dimethylaminohydrolase|nr:hypothetical protein [Mycobacteriales bacterium]
MTTGLGDDPSIDMALPTFAVLARFREPAGTREEALRAVERRLVGAEAPFDQVTAAVAEENGAWNVTARFVVASLDSSTAADGVHGTLRAAGLGCEEVWVGTRYT